MTKKRRLTQSEKDERKDARKAERMNATAEASAPLLAYAGLVQQTDAAEQAERRVEAKTVNYWRGVGLSETDAQRVAESGWLRYLIAMTVGEAEAARAERWVEGVARGLVWVGLACWRKAFAAMLSGEEIVPKIGTIQPSACYAMIDAARQADPVGSAECLRREWSRHDAAGCTRSWCSVAGVGQPEPVDLDRMDASA